MVSQNLLFSLFTFILLSVQGSAGRRHLRRQFRPTKLYVFGDSYVDTGNIGISNFSCWNFPYGITFPGQPSGRFSDGRVLTDYIAKYFGVKGPVPFRMLETIGSRGKKNGMNFAFGGTGVFDTKVSFPNMTNQIDLFEKFIVNHHSFFFKNDINSSLALVSASGNDYSFYVAQTPFHLKDFKAFIISVVNQIITNVKRINSLGVKNVVVTGLGPLGCLPQLTAPSSFSQCNATTNSLMGFHNLLLKQAAAKLNNEIKDSSFLILDIYGAFMPIIQSHQISETDHTRFESPLKPCCFGVSSGFSCGNVDEKGDKKFSLCQDPKSAFFWDLVHPTQQGWLAAFRALESNLNQLY